MESKDDSGSNLRSYWSKLKEIAVTTRKMPRVFALVWRANPRVAAVFVISQVILGLVPLAQVWSMKLLVDSVPLLISEYAGKHVTPSLLNMPYTVVLALVLISLAWFISETSRPIDEHCHEQLNDFLTRDITLLLTDKVNSFADISILESPKFYDKLQRLQSELMLKPIHMVHVFSQIGQAFISLISLSAVLCALNPLLVLLIAAVAIPKVIQQLKQMYQAWSVILGDVPEVRRMRYFAGVLTNNQDGKEIRMFGLSRFFRQNYVELFDKMQSARSKMRNAHLLKTVLLCAFSSVGTTVSYGYAVFQTLEGRITVGQMAMFLSTISQMETSLGYVTFLVSELYRHALYVNELFEFLDMGVETQVLKPEAQRPLPRPITRGIEFRNVSFKYPATENEILSGISFTIKPGETVALVGENGAGKTTIVKLLARLYCPTEGQILIDGIDLNELDVDAWRSALSVVFQDYCRFHMSLRDNVGVGLLSQMNRNGAVELAAERGGAASVAAKFSNGYDTMLGKMFEDQNKKDENESDEKANERVGIELSGGEWQRIALSRAFMRSNEDKNGVPDNGSFSADAELLILDEPTAALDVQSEYDVYCRFHELTAGKMALLITHRFSTVRIADTILVLDGGKIIESGSHEELMSRDDSSYAKLYNLQADRYK